MKRLFLLSTFSLGLLCLILIILTSKNESITVALTPFEIISATSEVIVKETTKINSTLKHDISIPILMYHTSAEEQPKSIYSELYVKPSEFEKQLIYLNENKYTYINFDDYENLENIENPIMLTFDDGYIENYTEIFPLLKKHNAKITIFLTIENIKNNNLSEDKIKEMSDSGLVKFESHTLTHPSLVKLSTNYNLLNSELEQSKIKINMITGKEVIALAYPNGEYNEIVKNIAKKYYKFGIRKDGGINNTKYDNFEICRIRINRSTSLARFKQYLTS